MIKRSIITIGRQFGSGGRLIGQKLAELLEIPFYDNQLITIAAEETGYSSDIFQQADEQATNSFLYSTIIGSYGFGGQPTGLYNMPINDKLFLVQSKIIKEKAEAGPCVIIGRCADYVLKDNPNCISIFVHAPKKDRIKRALEDYNMEVSGIEDKIHKIDKRRATYYNYYATNRWGKIETYEFSINSSVLGIDHTVTLISDLIKLKEKASSI